jgi:hypothetical protein
LSWFGLLKYIPLAGALIIAIAQYFPETVNKRIKLTFHLPLNENKVLLQMVVYGTICIMLVYLLMLCIFTALSALYFPSDIIIPALISLVPWFLCGLAAYFLTALMVLEPVWIYRLLYLVAALTFIPLFLVPSVAGGYAPANFILVVLVIILSIAILFSGYRFRKGEM